MRRRLGFSFSLPPRWVALLALGFLAPFIPEGWARRSRNSAPAEAVNIRLEILDCNDGDTCRARTVEGLQLKLRLLGLDAPETAKPGRGRKSAETGQAFGEEARRALNERAKGQTLDVEIRGNDAFGRSLALLYRPAAGKKDRELINEALIREGFAYAYRGRGVEKSIREWAERAEAEARDAKRGLWGLAKPPEDPSLYRRRQR